MRIFKEKKGIIISFIIGVIIASSITVYAYSYFASDISYKKPGTDTTISVETALNELYNKRINRKVVKTFTYEAGNTSAPYYGTKTFDIKKELPNYNSLTKDNFCIQVDKVGIALPGGSNVNDAGGNISILSYENGIITVDLQNTVRSGASPFMNISIIAFYIE